MKKILTVVFLALSLQGLYAQNNYSLQFDGVDDFVNIGGDVGNGIRTIELWFKLDSAIQSDLSIPQSLVVRDILGEDHEYGLYFGAANWPGQQGRLVFMRRINSDFIWIASDSSSWEADRWYHVAGLIDPVEGMKLYVDGVKQADTDSTVAPVDSTGEPTSIGSWGDKSIRFFYGSIDEVRFWDKALSDSEVLTYMNNCAAGSEQGLRAYWNFETGTDTIAADMTGNNYEGSLNNGVVWNSDAPGIICGATGIDKAFRDLQVSTYPNPTSGPLMVELKQDQHMPFAQVVVMDAFGRALQRTAVTGNSLQLNLANLGPAGLYFIQLLDDQNRLMSAQKIILN